MDFVRSYDITLPVRLPNNVCIIPLNKYNNHALHPQSLKVTQGHEEDKFIINLDLTPGRKVLGSIPDVHRLTRSIL